jgi:hypothetical protein
MNMDLSIQGKTKNKANKELKKRPPHWQEAIDTLQR